jgi:hypothetical protein
VLLKLLEELIGQTGGSRAEQIASGAAARVLQGLPTRFTEVSLKTLGPLTGPTRRSSATCPDIEGQEMRDWPCRCPNRIIVSAMNDPPKGSFHINILE